MILSIVLFALGVFCYTIKELQSHSKLKWMKAGTGFWDERSWYRKWDNTYKGEGTKEAFPGSSTIFVFVTDGYHLCQTIFLKLFVLSIVLYKPIFIWWVDGLIYLFTWYIVFNLTYKLLSK